MRMFPLLLALLLAMGAPHAQNIGIDTKQGVLFDRNDLTQRSSYYPKLQEVTWI